MWMMLCAGRVDGGDHDDKEQKTETVCKMTESLMETVYMIEKERKMATVLYDGEQIMKTICMMTESR